MLVVEEEDVDVVEEPAADGANVDKEIDACCPCPRFFLPPLPADPGLCTVTELPSSARGRPWDRRLLLLFLRLPLPPPLRGGESRELPSTLRLLVVWRAADPAGPALERLAELDEVEDEEDEEEDEEA